MIERKITCDHSGEILATGYGLDKRERPYITLKGGLAVQLHNGQMSANDRGEPVPFHFLTEYGRTYCFRDATALADWVDDRIEESGFTPLEDLNG